MTLSTEVYCTLQLAGTHQWPNCPFEEVGYLRDLHRHMFHIKAYKKVYHDDRDVEFIMLKSAITDYLIENYWLEQNKALAFGHRSCEMIARELIEVFDLCRCEVNEDGGNGAILTVVEDDSV